MNVWCGRAEPNHRDHRRVARARQVQVETLADAAPSAAALDPAAEIRLAHSWNLKISACAIGIESAMRSIRTWDLL